MTKNSLPTMGTYLLFPFRNLQKFLKGTCILTLIVFSILSCSSKDYSPDNDQSNYGKNNTQDVAVTGGPEEISYTSAMINGYVNIGAMILSAVNVGVLVSEASTPNKDNSIRINASFIEDGRAFKVLIDGLSPGAKYYYRTFVSTSYDDGIMMLGEVLSFTTKSPTANLTSPGSVSDISYTGASFTGMVSLAMLSNNDKYSVGVYIKTDDDFFYEYAEDINANGTYQVSFSNVCSAGKNYSWGTFIELTEQRVLSNETKTFSTKDGSSLIKIGKPYQVSYSSAFIDLQISKEVFDSDDWYIALFCIQDYQSGRSPYDYEINNGNEYCSYGNQDNYNPGFVELINGSTVVFNCNGMEIGGTFTPVVVLDFENEERVYLYLEGTPFSTLKYSSGEVIDLGLSVKWRNRNLGASSPEDVGDFFAWGETSPRKELKNVDDYQWYDKQKGWTKYNTSDNKRRLELSDDAAHVILKSSWRMPTLKEYEELNSACVWSPAFLNGHEGMIGVAPNKKAIFFPHSGCVSSSYLEYENFCWEWTAESFNERLAHGYRGFDGWDETVDWRYNTLMPIRAVSD